ncbi:MAG: hypothetical protein ACQEXJ_02535 [Myxococcota bacterium]
MSDPPQQDGDLCVRCGRRNAPETGRCEDCGFDLTSALQRDYERYRRGEREPPPQAAAEPRPPASRPGTGPRRRRTNPGMPTAMRQATMEPAADEDARSDSRGPDRTLDMGSDTLGRALDRREPTLDMRAAAVASLGEERRRAPTTGRRRRPAPPRPDRSAGGAPGRSTRRGPDTRPETPRGGPEPVGEALREPSTRLGQPGVADAKASAAEPGSRLSSTEPLGPPGRPAPPPEEPGESPVTKAWGDVFPDVADEAPPEAAAPSEPESPEPAPPEPPTPEPAPPEPPTPEPESPGPAAAEAGREADDTLATVVDQRPILERFPEAMAPPQEPSPPPEPSDAEGPPPSSISGPDRRAEATPSPPEQEPAAPHREDGPAPRGPDTGRHYLREGTTTYVDATRQGFRRQEGASGGGSVAVYVGIGVALGLAALAVFIWFART